MSDWDPLRYGLDYFLLEGQKSPGISRVAGFGPPRKWEERNGYGMSGSTIIFLGNGLAKWDTETELYTEEDWANWRAFKPLLKPPAPGRHGKAQDMWHPFLEEHELRSSVLVQPSFPTQVADSVWLIKLEWLQYRRPKLDLMKPEGSKGAEPPDPVDQYIKDLAGQVKELAG